MFRMAAATGRRALQLNRLYLYYLHRYHTAVYQSSVPTRRMRSQAPFLGTLPGARPGLARAGMRRRLSE
jgi:hypothetical protein